MTQGVRLGAFLWGSTLGQSGVHGKAHPLGRGVLQWRGMPRGYREDRQGPTLSVRDRGEASDQRPLLFTRP